jgi:hypothetical protein
MMDDEVLLEALILAIKENAVLKPDYALDEETGAVVDCLIICDFTASARAALSVLRPRLEAAEGIRSAFDKITHIESSGARVSTFEPYVFAADYRKRISRLRRRQAEPGGG